MSFEKCARPARRAARGGAAAAASWCFRGRDCSWSSCGDPNLNRCGIGCRRVRHRLPHRVLPRPRPRPQTWSNREKSVERAVRACGVSIKIKKIRPACWRWTALATYRRRCRSCRSACGLSTRTRFRIRLSIRSCPLRPPSLRSSRRRRTCAGGRCSRGTKTCKRQRMSASSATIELMPGGT